MKSRLRIWLQHVLPAGLCVGAAFLLARTTTFHRFEDLTADERTRLRAWFHAPVPADDLALVGIDDISLHDLGRWPWNREFHGDLLTLLGRVKPAVVAWDLLFTEPSPADDYLAKAGLGAGTVIYGANGVDDETATAPTDDAAKNARLTPLAQVIGDRAKIPGNPRMELPAGLLGQLGDIGFVDTPPEGDGVRRRAPLVTRIGDQVYPTLSLRALMAYFQAKPEDVTVRLNDAVEIKAPLGTRRIPVDETGAYWVNYRHSVSGFVSYSYSLTLGRLKLRYVDKSALPPPPLTGRIVLIGQTSEGLTDIGPTPLSPLTPLVLVHANVIENVLQQDYLRRPDPTWIWIGTFVFGFVGLGRFAERQLREQAVFSLGLPVAYLAAVLALWINNSWMLPVVGPLVGFGTLQVYMIGRRVLHEQRAKEQIKGMFGTYLSPQLVDRMVRAGEMPRLGGHQEVITAYFSDIQGFSGFSEILPPDRLVELMNEYLTACTDIVQEEGGTLDKYIGDAVVAMFGAPIALPDHAYRACVATQRVQQKLGELREKWHGEGERWPEIVWKMQTRIGLNSGPAIIGNMGSRTRFNYTMMGDNVNLAARMESGAKSWGVYAMASEATRLACVEHGGDRVVFRALGRIQVMGRAQPVPVYEIVGLRETAAAATHECIAIFERGLERYYARDWDGAIAFFRQSAPLEPNQPGKTSGVKANPSTIYLEIVAGCKAEPPPAAWDGVYIMKEK